MDKTEAQSTLYDLRAKGAIEQAKGHIQRANALVSEGMRRIAPDLRDDPEHNPFLGIRMKLLFQTRYWDPVLFDPDNAETQAIVSPSRYTLGLLWRTAYVLWHTGRPSEALRCFHIHRELSEEAARGQELGNGIYVHAHTSLQIDQADVALERFLETSREFARDYDNPASFYFTDFTKFSHLLAGLSIAFHQTGCPNKALYCLALSDVIFQREDVVVEYAGGIETFCCTAQRIYPFAHEYLSGHPLRREVIRGRIPALAFLHEQARELLDSPSSRDIMTASFYEDLAHASDDDYAQHTMALLPPPPKEVKPQVTAPGAHPQGAVGTTQLDAKLCFVLMPMEDKFVQLYEEVIKPTVMGLGLMCYYAVSYSALGR